MKVTRNMWEENQAKLIRGYMIKGVSKKLIFSGCGWRPYIRANVQGRHSKHIVSVRVRARLLRGILTSQNGQTGYKLCLAMWFNLVCQNTKHLQERGYWDRSRKLWQKNFSAMKIIYSGSIFNRPYRTNLTD